MATPATRFVEDINELDFPDYTVFDRNIVVYGSPPNINVMISRGCSYERNFCSNHAMRGAYESSQGYSRSLTPDNTILFWRNSGLVTRKLNS